MPAPQPRLAELGPLERALLVTDDVEIEVLDAGGTMPARIVPDQVFRPDRFLPYAARVDSVQVDDLETYVRDTGYYGMEFAYDWFPDGMVPAGPPLVRRVAPGSPADKAGLGAGDGVYMMRAGGKKLTNLDVRWAAASEYRRDIPVGERLSFEACQNAGSDAGSCPDLRGTMKAATQPRPYKVRVHVPGRNEPLYGRLAFFNVYSTAQGSASRVYRLEVPQQYVERARGGNVSVVYQPYKARYVNPIWGPAEWKHEHASWALWLSDVPFD